MVPKKKAPMNSDAGTGENRIIMYKKNPFMPKASIMLKQF